MITRMNTLLRRPKMNRIVIIGRGPWGTALSRLFKPSALSIRSLDESSTSTDWAIAMKHQPLIVFACPFKVIASLLKKIKDVPLSGLLCASKGIDRESLQTFSGLAAAEKIQIPYGSLSGPTFAAEVLQKKPSACVIASRDAHFARLISKQISNAYFRIYTNNDPVGVEVCGAMKNIFAIACGISDGLKLGYNARAALLSRALKEMEACVIWLGGKPSTVYGLSGVGDLLLTATGDLSRNRQLGLQLAKGLSLSQATKKIKGICEGVYTVEQAYKLSVKHKAELPITEQIYRICFKKQKPATAIHQLMTRELKTEQNLSR